MKNHTGRRRGAKRLKSSQSQSGLYDQRCHQQRQQRQQPARVQRHLAASTTSTAAVVAILAILGLPMDLALEQQLSPSKQPSKPLVFDSPLLSSSSSMNKEQDRRSFMATSMAVWCGIPTTTVPLVARPNLSPARAAEIGTTSSSSSLPSSVFVYSDTWTGTRLPLVSLDHLSRAWASTSSSSTSTSSSLEKKKENERWTMGRWPDPLLRRPADPVATQWLGSGTLRRAARVLQETANRNHAVGLAAQQCGINARMIYLQKPPVQSLRLPSFAAAAVTPTVLVNPHIVRRSPETRLQVWTEECLVLPPSFRATVLRDEWIDVQYLDLDGCLHRVRLHGEQSRCLQHEMDHDRGILILDHIGLQEMENDVMRGVEARGHDERMSLAYSRQVDDDVYV